MNAMIDQMARLHAAIAGRLEAISDRWLMGLAARLAFASVLFGYYWNSALTKVGTGFAGFFTISDGAYYQMLPPVIEAAGYDTANVAFFPWKIIVIFGTYAEFALPLLIVLGLATRLAAFGMIGFIAVQSYVDIMFHNIGAEATGAFFDRFPDAIIADQRLLWVLPLAYLVFKGAGLLSVDGLIARRAEAAPAAMAGRAA